MTHGELKSWFESHAVASSKMCLRCGHLRLAVAVPAPISRRSEILKLSAARQPIDSHHRVNWAGRGANDHGT